MRLSRLLATIGALSTIALVEFPLTTLAQNRPVRARVSQPVDVHDLVTLQGNVHPLARPEFDQGVAPDDLPMERMLLVLQRGAEQEAALRQLLDDQQVKSSPRFHQWLTPEEFGQQFGPADSDLQAITDWLASAHALSGFDRCIGGESFVGPGYGDAVSLQHGFRVALRKHIPALP